MADKKRLRLSKTLSGHLGGTARAKTLPKAKRVEIARQGGQALWQNIRRGAYTAQDDGPGTTRLTLADDHSKPKD